MRSLVASFVRCDEEQKKAFSRSNRPRAFFQRRLNYFSGDVYFECCIYDYGDYFV